MNEGILSNDENTRHTALMPIDISGTLDPTRLRVLNWNIQKQSNPRWRRDLEALNTDLNLALFQEVHLEDGFLACFEPSWCHSFARGWSSRGRTTGVATLASVGHLSHSPLVAREPLLRTPKATNITTYALEGSRETLLVINLHAVNFSLGTYAYQQQLRGIAAVLEEHAGPVIFAGDFNAWHPGRERLIRDLACAYAMEEVLFDEDYRTRVFGYCLDYIFVRGLRTDEASIRRVDSSDHNPLLASFSL